MWTSRFKFSHASRDYRVEIPVGLSAMTAIVTRDGTEVGRDHVVYEVDGTRNLLARVALDDGRRLDVEAGYINWWQTAIAVRVDGALIHESYPGKTIAWPASMAIKPSPPGEREARAAQVQEQGARFTRNMPSLLTDIALGVAFFFIGSAYGIVTAAVTGAIAGVVLWVVQKITKIDLLGGLAVFGIVISLISAGFAVLFQDPWIVQMRTTIIGGFVASLFLIDGVFFKGKWLGARLERYMPPGTSASRLATGIAALGVIMAGTNWAVTTFASQQVWLFYSSFLDIPLAMVLGVSLVYWAREPAARA